MSEKTFKAEFGNPSTKIEWKVTGNPKRPHGASHGRFEKYFGKTTVEEYLQAGGTKADLRYDFGKGFLELMPTEEPANEAEQTAAETESVDAVLEAESEPFAETETPEVEDKPHRGRGRK